MKTSKEYYGEHGIWYDNRGYPCIWIDRKEAKLHVYIWEKENGQKPKKHEIHHLDLDKRNYSIENLELMTCSDHKRLHAGWVRNDYIWTKKPCGNCNKILKLGKFYYIKTRNTLSTLCKECHNSAIAERNRRPEIREKIKANKREYREKLKLISNRSASTGIG